MQIFLLLPHHIILSFTILISGCRGENPEVKALALLISRQDFQPTWHQFQVQKIKDSSAHYHKSEPRKILKK